MNATTVISRWLHEARDSAQGRAFYRARRLQRRYPWSAALEICLKDTIMPCQAIDITPGTIGFYSREPLPEGAMIEIRRPEEIGWVRATVHTCASVITKYKVVAVFETHGDTRESARQRIAGLTARVRFDDDDQVFDIDVADLSWTGAAIAVNRAVSAGQMLVVLLKSDDSEVEVRATVTRLPQPEDKSRIIGVAFETPIDPETLSPVDAREPVELSAATPMGEVQRKLLAERERGTAIAGALTGSPLKALSDKWFELLLITLVLGFVVIVHQLARVPDVILHFFYIPVIIAAYVFGRTLAGLIALLAFLSVTVFAIADPGQYAFQSAGVVMVGLRLCVWGGFLGLVAIIIGTLAEERANKIRELKEAHIGIIEILSKYLQSADQYTRSHSMRVADLAEAIAHQLRLKPEEVENVRVGALLHDIGKVEISTRLIQKAAGLSEAERAEVASHTVHGAELVRSLGAILSGAVPLIRHHHDHYAPTPGADGLYGEHIPIGARIIAVADAYDAIVTDRPYRKGRTPQEAVIAIRAASGTQFDPQVVAAFERAIQAQLDEADIAELGVREIGLPGGALDDDGNESMRLPSQSLPRA